MYLIDLVTIHPSDKSTPAGAPSFDETSDIESSVGTIPGRSPRGGTLAKGFVEIRPFSVTRDMDSRLLLDQAKMFHPDRTGSSESLQGNSRKTFGRPFESHSQNTFTQ